MITTFDTVRSSYLVILLLAIFGWSSCTQIIDIDLPEHEPRIVLNAYLMAGDTFSVASNANRETFIGVSRSNAAISRGNVVDLPDAIVRVKADGALITTVTPGLAFGVAPSNWWGPWDPNRPVDSVYHYPFPSSLLQAGVTYRVEAEHPDFENPLVWGDQTIPTQPIVENVTKAINENATIISFDLVDGAEKGELYLVRVFSHISWNNQFSEDFFSCIDPSFSSLSWADEFGDISGELNYTYQGLIRDESFNGTRRRFELRMDSWWNSEELENIAVEVTKITPEFERYLRSFYLNEVASFNPFAEPVQVFYNVKNGYGAVLAGHRVIRYTN